MIASPDPAGASNTPVPYALPANRQQYLPLRSERIDRWFQAPNSSNVRTTRKIIEDLSERYIVGVPARLVDPFVGAGSVAMAARHMGIAFVGIEIDPVLACVTLAKTLADRRLMWPSPGRRPSTSRHTLFRECLEVVKQVRRVRRQGGFHLDVAADLMARSAKPQPVALHWGDATDALAWEGLFDRPKVTVIYTSPPFGHTKTDPWPPTLVNSAKAILAHAGLDKLAQSDVQVSSYSDLAVGMLRNASAFIGECLVVMEHEPVRMSVRDVELSQILCAIETGADAVVLEVLETQNYSGKGTLSLIVCRVGNRGGCP